MSRRVAAPVLLLLAAAVSLAAVFAVQRIESGGGPLAEPWASTYFSPNGDHTDDLARVRFTTKRAERVTVRVVDSAGHTVATLTANERVDGKRELRWDGTTTAGDAAPEGTYRIRITRSGDDRVYSPTRPTVLDITPPIGRLDRATYTNGELRGLALLEPDTRLEIVDSTGAPLEDLRAFLPNPDAHSAQPVGPPIADTVPVRFTVPLDLSEHPLDTLGIFAVDLAGNRTDLRTADGAPTIAVID